MSISRRDLIKSLSLTAAAESMLRVVPRAAAETAHRMVSADKAASSSGRICAQIFPRASVQNTASFVRGDHSSRQRKRRRGRSRRARIP